MSAPDELATIRAERPATHGASEPSHAPNGGDLPAARDRWVIATLAAMVIAAAAAVAITGGGADTVFLIAVAYITVVGLWLAIIDLRTHRLPDRLVLPSYGVLGALLAISAVLEADGAVLARAAVTAALTGLVYVAMNRWGSMGLGDVKLGGLLGLVLGWASWSAALAGPVLGFLLAFVVAIALLVTGKGRGTHIAFGPYLIGGALLAIVQHLAAW